MRAHPPVAAVLLDAFGTLLTLDDPVPRLAAALAGAGRPAPADAVAAAFAREVAWYRANQDAGRDAASLAALRRSCAEVFAAALPDPPPVDDLVGILLGALRYRLFDDAVPALDALRAAGPRIAVVSNWDCSLPGILDRLGVGDRFDAVVVSATAGARKPDPAIFRAALAAVGAPPSAAVHCGDREDEDVGGALAAGVRAVRMDRAGCTPPGPVPSVGDLRALAALVAPAAG